MPVRAPASRFVLVALVERMSRWQRIVALVAVGLVVAWSALRGAARIMLDRWWLETVTDADVWRIRTVAQLQLLVGVGLVTAAVLGTSLWFVLRIGALQRSEPHRMIQRYHQRMGPAHRWLLIGGAVLITLRIGGAAAQQWRPWLLFLHGGQVGIDAPVIGGDIGFHLFDLPFLTAASSYLRQLLVLTLVGSAFGHIMSGALRLPSSNHRWSRHAIAHVATLAAALLAMQGLHDVLVRRPSIATNRVGTFDGPGWTELHITKPGLVIVALAFVAAGFGAIWLARTGRWRLLFITTTIAVVAHLAVVVAAPAVAERFVVAPAEAQRQLWSIADNLDATTRAFDLADVDTVSVELAELAPAGGDGARADSDVAVPNIDIERTPLFATASMARALQVLVGTTGTRIRDVDIDRYEIDGDVRPLFLAVRSASRPDVPESGWVQEHLVYTHGDGVVAVPADRTTDDGRPDTSALAGALGVDHLPLYFGESLDEWYTIVGTKRVQLGGSEFAGRGIDISSFTRRLALSLTVGESQPLFSNELTDESQLLFRRSVRERVGALAPFLALDGDPYPIVDGGRVVWVLDGYTTSTTYPSSQFMSGAGMAGSSDLAGRSFNYLHAAVKATVDAESGETHLYRTDDDDPIIDAWDGIFPGLLEPAESIPVTLRSRLRYPDDQWTVQSALIGRYHVDSAEQLFNGTDRWAISAAAATAVGDTTPGAAPSVDEFSALASGGDGFVALRPLGPGSATNPTSTRDELSAIVVADHGLDGALRVIEPTTADGSPLLSPQVAQSAIDADPEFARTITLLNANGSKVEFGPMTPVVSAAGLVWVRPIIVYGTGAAAAPRLYGVAAVAEGLVAVEASATEAVDAVTRQASAE